MYFGEYKPIILSSYIQCRTPNVEGRHFPEETCMSPISRICTILAIETSVASVQAVHVLFPGDSRIVS